MKQAQSVTVNLYNLFRRIVDHKTFSPFFSAFVPFKEDKLENELQKDAAHADVAKADEDEADPNYDEYSYDDVSCKFHYQNTLETPQHIFLG